MRLHANFSDPVIVPLVCVRPLFGQDLKLQRLTKEITSFTHSAADGSTATMKNLIPELAEL